VPFNPDLVSQEGFVPGTLGNEGLNGSFDPMMAGGDVYQVSLAYRISNPTDAYTYVYRLVAE
jgi:hypothetical protein